jgi:hypothetical protein
MSSTTQAMGRIATRSRRAPAKAWYWLAAAVVVLGVGCGLAWGVTSTIHTRDHAEGLPRTSLPGTLQVSVGTGDSQLIFFEGEGRPSPEAIGLTVTASDGSAVPVKPYDLIMDYDIAGWTGSPIASFSAPVQGTYTVTAADPYRDGRMAVGENFLRAQAISIVGALALIVASVVAGVVIVTIVAVRHSASSRTDQTRQA